ncbi:MAG: glucoamylase family protein, partial [Kofleriaceae bacterium]
HRWVRGDWQLVPWLFARVPSPGGAHVRNVLAGIDRWKIVDNLRRSLTGPALLVFLVLGWTWLPGSPLGWTIGAVAVQLAPRVRMDRRRLPGLGRALLGLALLAHESSIVADAFARVVVRTLVTRKHLLQWTTAAHAERAIDQRSPRRLYWRALAASPVLAIDVAGLVAWARPAALAVAAPLLTLWLVAPELARWISTPRPRHAPQLHPDERKQLRRLARRTWRFFDAFVGPADQWLVVDNYQAEPYEQTAHRTSPTNIGLMLLATLSAYDFGYLGPSELALRLRRAFDSIDRLPHYQGHLFNWYDTRSLQALLPRYVSTVDSGNFAGCLVALAQGCREVACSPVVRTAAWQGLADSVGLVDEAVASIPAAAGGGLRAVVTRVQALVDHGIADPANAHVTLCTLCDEAAVDLDREVLDFVETGTQRLDADLLRPLREAIERFHQQLRQMRRHLETLLPWLMLRGEPAARAVALPTELRLDEIPAVTARLHAELEAWRREQGARDQLAPALDASAQRIDEALQSAGTQAAALHADLLALAVRAAGAARGTDFRLLYDVKRKLFHIGYDVTTDRVDFNHYDLLASEARLASYLAIVKGDVTEQHWYALGRPMTSIDGAPALLSWGGTMFEYLMPGLLMRSRPHTLLARSMELAVDAQRAWGARRGAPWGVSESGYARRDPSQTYQYRSFGVPGLGFKRGLEDDRVVTPYASLLAVAIRPHEVIANLAVLEELGMRGTYGLFEAVDLSPLGLERATNGRHATVVRSYMAHHQAMTFISLGNLLNDRSMVDRFHADPVIARGELLLDERAPGVAPREWLLAAPEAHHTAGAQALPQPPAPWSSVQSPRPQAFVLGNGRLTSLVTDGGGGGLVWHGLALTGYEPDAVRDTDGLWIYLRDEASHRVWLATSPQGRTTYAMHKIGLHCRAEGISVHVDVVVAPADDVELRQITLHNETGVARRLTVTSAGRPVLVAQREASVHPAFSSMFVESERLAELEGLAFARRAKSPDEAPAVLVHRLVREGAAVAFAGDETDRAAFYGRGQTLHTPAALVHGRGPLRGGVGAMLDPIMCVMASVELAPNATVTLAFVTTIARSRTAAVELARRYGSMHAVRWAFRDAELESARQLRRAKLDPALVPSIQRLFSGLLFADPALRAQSGARPAPHPSKRRLWGRGISGDDPIMLVRIHEANAPLLRETLAAQRYLRWCGVRSDLVLIDAQATGYDSDGSGTLRRVLAEHQDHDWLGRHGGVHVLAADRESEDERLHLEAAARVVLDTRDDSLGASLQRSLAPRVMPPRFEATLPGAAPPPSEPPRRPALIFDNGAGGFTADGREYVILSPPGGATPAPWCNVLANDQFGCLVSESSLGA